MRKLKRLHYFHYLVTGKNIKQEMEENRNLYRCISPLGKLSKSALPF